MKMKPTINNRLSRRKAQRGYGLIDVLLGVAISAALILGAFTIYKRVSGDTTANGQIRGTIALLAEINRLYSQSGSYTGLTTASAITAKIVPNEFKTPTTTSIQHAWGGALDIAVGDQAGATPTSKYKLTFTGVDPTQCLHFVTGVAANAASLWVGGTTAGTHDVVPAATGAFDPAKAATQCSTATSATNIILVSN